MGVKYSEKRRLMSVRVIDAKFQKTYERGLDGNISQTGVYLACLPRTFYITCDLEVVPLLSTESFI